MKVKELIEKLSKVDPEIDVLCFCENQELLPGKHEIRLLEINDLIIADAEKERGDDNIPSLKFCKSVNSFKHALIEVSSDF